MNATNFTTPDTVVEDIATDITDRLLDSTPEDAIPHIRESLKTSLLRILQITDTARGIVLEESVTRGDQVADFEGIGEKVSNKFQENGIALSQSDISDHLVKACVHLIDSFYLSMLPNNGRILNGPTSSALN